MWEFKYEKVIKYFWKFNLEVLIKSNLIFYGVICPDSKPSISSLVIII